MKIYVNCKSLLLQKSIEVFLRNKLCSASSADVIVSDYEFATQKPLLIIGSSKKSLLKTPFTKTKLLSAIEKLYEEQQARIAIEQGASDFEEELNAITAEFNKKIKRLFVKKLYEATNKNKN